MLHRVVVTLRPGLIAQFQLLEEIPGRAVLAFADLPAVILSLLVGCPARIGAAERQARHAERQNVDAPVALAGRRVARHRRAAGLVGIPWPPPWRRAGLQGGDDAVGNLLVVVARHAIGVAAAVHRLVGGVGVVHRSVLPHGLLEHPSNPESRLTGARARSLREATADPLRRADGDAGGHLISFSQFRIPPALSG